METLEELYKSAPYEPLEATESNQKQYVRKFNSVTHFISYVKTLDEKFSRGSSCDSSDSSDWDSIQFTMTDDLKSSYDVIRSTVFDSKNTDKLQALIREVKKQTRFAEEGVELAVPEYLAGSDKYWIEQNPQKKPSKIIDNYLFIDVCCNAGKQANKMQERALDILIGIYQRNVIPRKIVVVIKSREAVGYEHDVITFIDVNFSDLNGIAKAMHPSTFRRLHFRTEEIFSGLNYGYGRAPNDQNSKGYISLDRSYGFSQEQLDAAIDTFLGVIKK